VGVVIGDPGVDMERGVEDPLVLLPTLTLLVREGSGGGDIWRLLTELGGDGRCGSLGGLEEVARLILMEGSRMVWPLSRLDTLALDWSFSCTMPGSVAGLASAEAETSSYDPESESLSMGYDAMKFEIDPGVDGSVSEDSETEWNEDIEDACVCLE